MKILLDSNILMSAFISPSGTVAKAYAKAVGEENEVIVADYNIEELRTAIGRKYSNRREQLEVFLTVVQGFVQVVSVPDRIIKLEEKIRDTKDRPILRVAICEDVDIILTGDKDFLEAGIKWPMIMSPAEFLEYEDTPPTDPLLVAERKHKYSRKIK